MGLQEEYNSMQEEGSFEHWSSPLFMALFCGLNIVNLLFLLQALQSMVNLGLFYDWSLSVLIL
jgi:hypothetical protein